jgi:hypothetical protein
MLIEASEKQGIQGFTLLDIGGGVGAVQYALLHAGVDHATRRLCRNSRKHFARRYCHA